MAKFCIKCGTKLMDGKCSNCTQESNVEKYKDILLDSFVGIYKKPVDTMKNFVKKENFILSLILLGISGILVAIFTTFFVGHTAVTNTSMFFGNVVSTLPFTFYATVFIKTLLTTYLLFTLLSCLLYFISDKVFKGETQLEKMFCLLGSMTFILIPSLFLSFLSMYISLSLLLLIFLSTSVLLLFNLYEGLSIASKIKTNYKAYTFLISIITLVLIFVYIIPGVLN